MRRLAAALVLLPVLSACTSPATPQAAAPVAEVGLGGVPVPVAPPPVDVPADEPVVEAGPDDPAVPPGDPGVDAPSAPEPAATEVHAHDEELPRRVPPSALLGAADLGPGWATARTPEGACAPRATGPSVRGALVSDTGSTLVESVSVEADAVGAVAGWRRALEACGYAVSPLALGEAGIAADGGRRARAGDHVGAGGRRRTGPRPARHRPGTARLGGPGPRLVLPRRAGRLPLAGLRCGDHAVVAPDPPYRTAPPA